MFQQYRCQSLSVEDVVLTDYCILVSNLQVLFIEPVEFELEQIDLDIESRHSCLRHTDIVFIDCRDEVRRTLFRYQKIQSMSSFQSHKSRI